MWPPVLSCEAPITQMKRSNFSMANRTPFFERHLALGGKIVDFHGWELPVQYSTITLEHNAVRSKAGLFDISHMGQLLVWGEEAFAFLQYVITNDLHKATPGKGIYAHVLNDRGGVIDDIFVFRFEDQKFLLIKNASRRSEDPGWPQTKAKRFKAEILEPPFAAGLALQGPQAMTIAGKLNPAIENLDRHHIGEFDIGDVSAHVTRSGYTGEDGVEFFGPAGHLLLIWDQFMAVGAPM